MEGQYQYMEDQLKVFVRDIFIFFSVLDMYKVLEPFKKDMNDMKGVNGMENTDKSRVFNISPEKYLNDKKTGQDMAVGLFGQTKMIVGELTKAVVGNNKPQIDINLSTIVDPIELDTKDMITLILASYYIWSSQQETSRQQTGTPKQQQQPEISASENQIKVIKQKYQAEIKNGDPTCRRILQSYFASVDKKGFANLYISYLDNTHSAVVKKVNMLTTTKIDNIGREVTELVDMVKNDPLNNSC